MGHAVCVTADGSRVFGTYDSYGGLGRINLVDLEEKFSVYHRACWEIAGKPEYKRQSGSARDQGFCHAMHGQPIPKPTGQEWFAKAKMWQAVNGILRKYQEVTCSLRKRWSKDQWLALGPDRQAALRAALQADKDARRARRDEALKSYCDSEDLEMENEEPPNDFVFDGLTFDYLWIDYFAFRT